MSKEADKIPHESDCSFLKTCDCTSLHCSAGRCDCKPAAAAPVEPTPPQSVRLSLDPTDTHIKSLPFEDADFLCPQGCGGKLNPKQDFFCPSCRRPLDAIQLIIPETFPELAMGAISSMTVRKESYCWEWFGPADHRMKCRLKKGHRGEHDTHEEGYGDNMIISTDGKRRK